MTARFLTPFERLGGRAALHRIIDDFYARIDADRELRPIFPDDLVPGRERQKLFLEQWLGGEPLYERAHGPPMMRRRHLPFVITVPAAERWLKHFGAALASDGTEERLATEIMTALRPVAMRMVNTREVDEPGARGRFATEE
ncbi:MAG: globin [Chloroflexi bacterium]|nr:globin [Chloroflexota bacterium]